MAGHELDEEERRRVDEELQKRRERELHWKIYESASRRRLVEEYYRSRGDADIVRGGTPLDPQDGRRVLEDPDY